MRTHYQGDHHEQCGFSPIGKTEKCAVSVNGEPGSSPAGLSGCQSFIRLPLDVS